MSTPIASGSPKSALVRFSLTMVCALYPLCAILLSTTARPETRRLGFQSPWQRSKEHSVPDPALNTTVPATKQAGLAFFDHAMNLLQELRRTQAGVIQKAAELCADRIARGGGGFLFWKRH